MRPLALISLVLLLWGAPALALEDFGVVCHGESQEGKTPPQGIESNGYSSYNSTLTWMATADRGIFRSRSKLENDYVCQCTPQIFPGADRAYTYWGWITIDGPEGQIVNGTMHLEIEGALEQAGEYPWTATVGYQVWIANSEAEGFLAMGGDGSLSGTGGFAGATSPIVDRAIDVPFAAEPGWLPVTIVLETDAMGTSFGSGYNMGSSNFHDDRDGDGLAGISFRRGSPAFTLPAGYVANSSMLAIQNSWWIPPASVSVPAGAPRDGALALAISSNPVRGGTAVHYTLPRAGAVRVEVLDLQGRVVALLDDGWREAGPHPVSWTAGRDVRAGLYFVRARFGAESLAKKVTVLE